MGLRFYTQEESSSLIEKIVEYDKEIDSLLKLGSEKKRAVYIFKDRETYQDYLRELEVEPREDFIYIEYTESSDNKLLIYKGYKNLDSSLKYHLTLQYIEEYGGAAPEWFKTGLSQYFVYRNLERDLAPKGEWEVFLYLINNNSRVLWDSLSYLRWNNKSPNYIENLFLDESIKDKSRIYLSTILGYKEQIELLKKDYNSGNYQKVLDDSSILIEAHPDRYSTYYYRGLAYSKLSQFSNAYSALSTALDKGAPKDTAYYSIGVNFYIAKEFKNSRKYLEKIESDSPLYDNCQKLLKEIK